MRGRRPLFVCVAVLQAAGALGAADVRLVQAVKSRDVQAAAALIKQNVDVNVRQPDGATALQWAAHWDDVHTAGLLLGAGADANAVNDYGVPPLTLAATNGSAPMIQLLVKGGANPNAALPTGETVLMTAARTGNLDAVRALLAAGAEVNRRENTKGQTALMWALSQQHLDVARVLIDRGAEVRSASRDGFTPLMFVARGGDVDAARLLLARGASANDTAADGGTALLVATVRGHVELARYLLAQGADPNTEAAGYTPLHWAAGKWEGMLTSKDAGIVAPPGEWQTLAGVPTRAGKIDLINALLAAGAHPNAQVTKDPPRFGYSLFKMNLAGATPLLLAAMVGDVEVMRLLVAHGADPQLRTKAGMSPLIMAAGFGRVTGETRVDQQMAVEAIRALLEWGADINETNPVGDTALHAAAYSGEDTIVRFLVDRGARVNTRNKNGQTPVAIAEGHYLLGTGMFLTNVSTVALLKSLGGTR